MSGPAKKQFIKNFSFVFGAQTLVLIISVIRALLLPKMFSVESFGYWEIYWFYTCYVGLFCLGYNDGLYLKYGDKDYAQLPHKLIRSATRWFSVLLTFFSALCIVLVLYIIEDENLKYALIFSSLNIWTLGLTGVFIYVFQITNQFKKYSFFSVIDKIFVLITIGLLLVMNNVNFKIIICVDFFSKLLIVMMMIYKAKELFFGRMDDFKNAIHFLFENMSIGIKLMIANLMSMLLVGAGKFIVQYFGGIQDFAIYSFGMSVTGLVLTAVTAISLVLYPMIKRMNSSSYLITFERINLFIRSFGLVALLFYFPAYIFISSIYPKYISVLPYLNFLFVIVFFQSKISLLNNTFYKVLRKEREMLYANMNCVIVFIVLSVIGYNMKSYIGIIAFCTMLAMGFRSYFSEMYLIREMKGRRSFLCLVEILFLMIFLIVTFELSILYSFLIYSCCLLSYLFFEKNKLINFLVVVRK